MSNTVINWRFWTYHLQVLRWGDWWPSIRRGDWGDLFRWRRNLYHARGGAGRDEPGWTPIAFYEGRRYALALGLLVVALIGWAV